MDELCSLVLLVANHPMSGVQALFAQADFLSFIVDRQEEASKRALEAKYACVRNALAHSDIAEVRSIWRANARGICLVNAKWCARPFASSIFAS